MLPLSDILLCDTLVGVSKINRYLTDTVTYYDAPKPLIDFYKQPPRWSYKLNKESLHEICKNLVPNEQTFFTFSFKNQMFANVINFVFLTCKNQKIYSATCELSPIGRADFVTRKESQYCLPRRVYDAAALLNITEVYASCRTDECATLSFCKDSLQLSFKHYDNLIRFIIGPR